MFNNKNIFRLLIGLSVIGIFLASYLFYNFLTKPMLESCYVNSIVNCDAVTKGSLSTILGVPVSIVGLIGYIVILIAALLKRKNIILLMSTFGMLFCLYITIQEVFFLKVICPVCLSCQLVMLCIFILSLKLKFKPKNK